jgi:FkbH-like protein
MSNSKWADEFYANDLLSKTSSSIQKLAKRYNSYSSKIQQPKEKLKVAIVGGFTVDFLVDMLPLMFFQYGFGVDIYKGGYGEIASELLIPDSGLHTFKPDLIIVLPTYRDLIFFTSLGVENDKYVKSLQEELIIWKDIWSSVSVPIVQLSFDPPPSRSLGELDGFMNGGLLNYVRQINQLLVDNAPAHVGFIDAEYIAFRVGLEKWHDAHLYQMSKQPFSFDVLPILSHAIAARSQGIMSIGKKVLVVDLDNTLWGGVIGDDGLEGIILGPETAEGEAFTVFQQYIKELVNRGVVLAVCSKNNIDIAMQVFHHHSGMILSEDDVAHFEVNFKDKVTNIRRIAKVLNVGLDALVFVDDNPLERFWVQEQLTDVMVVDLPQDPADYIRELDKLNAFCVQRITNEDLGRSQSYQARKKITKLENTDDAMSVFLQNLQSEIVIEQFGGSTLDRVIQLLGKTNQFNLTQKRYSAEELKDKSIDVIIARLRDRVQDYGIVSVVVTKRNKEYLEIDNWVMSCRVFSRRLEYAIQEILIKKSKQTGCQFIHLEHKVTDRNGILTDVIRNIGYDDLGGNKYEMSIKGTYKLIEHYIKITTMEII